MTSPNSTPSDSAQAAPAPDPAITQAALARNNPIIQKIEAQEKGVAFKKGQFPWMASGPSLSLGRDEGFTKLLFDPETHQILGGGIVGTNAGELISEIALGIEMGADAADIGLTVHPHPTLSETVAFAAELTGAAQLRQAA